MTWTLIPGDGRALRYPDACACCGRATTERWDVIPYCAPCRAHTPVAGPWLVALVAVAAGAGMAYAARRALPFVPLVAYLGLVAAAALLLPLLLLLAHRLRPLPAPHVGREQAAELVRGGVQLRSAAYARQVAALNEVQPQAVIVPALHQLERLLPFLTCLLPLLGAVQLFPRWHATLWIDNGGARAVIVRAGGRQLATVPAGAQRRVTIPRDRLRLQTLTAGEIIDDETIDTPDAPGAFVLNVGALHCYEVRSYAYAKGGKGFYLTPEPARHDATLFVTAAHLFFEPPPAEILVELPPRGLAGLPQVRRILDIVPCE